MQSFLETVVRKVIIAVPFLVIVFFIFGTIREHGDTNAGGMYPIVFTLPGLGYTLLCYVLFYFVDEATKRSRWNLIKYVVHLLLLIESFWLTPNSSDYTILLLTVGTILVINISTALLVEVNRT